MHHRNINKFHSTKQSIRLTMFAEAHQASEV